MKLRYLIFITLIFFSKVVYSWTFDNLDSITQGCMEQSKQLTSSGETNWMIGENYEYCGCTTNGISKNFSLFKVLELLDSNSMLSNKVYLKIVDDCLQKIGK